MGTASYRINAVAVAVAMRDAMRTRENFMMAEVVKLKAAEGY